MCFWFGAICSYSRLLGEAHIKISSSFTRGSESLFRHFCIRAGEIINTRSRNVFEKAIWTLCKQKEISKTYASNPYHLLLYCATVFGHAIVQILISDSYFSLSCRRIIRKSPKLQTHITKTTQFCEQQRVFAAAANAAVREWYGGTV